MTFICVNHSQLVTYQVQGLNSLLKILYVVLSFNDVSV